MAEIHELARAKINLDLHVLGRRADGYHEIDSLMAFTAFGDVVTIVPAPALTLSLDGPFAAGLPVDETNLVIRAARGLQSITGIRAGASLAVTKNIPAAAGLGGGSADAGATLRGLCRLWRITPPADGLDRLAASLGADVPACLHSRPVRATGIGEKLEPLALPEGLGVLLVNPRQPLATATVFQGVRAPFAVAPNLPARLDRNELLAALLSRRNDLEAPAIAACPAVADVLMALRGLPGCRIARMSGSGATCFALFADAAAAQAAGARLAADQPGWWIQATVFDSPAADG